ncbi:MAG: phosphate propanoyltransferase [Desulfitobacteriaceae bacterium]|nr:phosphate propanoyltransferase [Desulfitobacteriaceae bacterium]MDI6878645.1 phosphate propanoyltransferase [Desulfitobacteriaceae bacterium]MDI6914343.1 phosphate propanoyltransferase [Desulfitobacteriaceae bacterium]
MMNYKVPIEISNRHVHLSQDHIEVLFGPGHILTPMKALSQPGQYACEETITLVGPKGTLEKIRVLGPARAQSQVELARTDTFKLGVKAPARDSGDLDGTPGIELVGSHGKVQLASGVIVATRHIHMAPSDAARFGLRDGSHVRVEIPGARGGIFSNVLIRVSANSHMNMHIDTDEGNAFDVSNCELVNLLFDDVSLAAR